MTHAKRPLSERDRGCRAGRIEKCRPVLYLEGLYTLPRLTEELRSLLAAS